MPSIKDASRSLSLICVIFTLVVVQPPVTSLKHKHMICDQISQCVCQFPSGDGLNLTVLGSETLKFNDSEHGVIFYFNPCIDAQGCPSGSVLCMLEENNQTTDLSGMNHQLTFSYEGTDNPIFVNYDNGAARTKIQLECWGKNETSFVRNITKDESEPGAEFQFHFLVRSPEACLKSIDNMRSNVVSEGLSNGALFVLVLLILWCAYILVGAASKHFIMGATGWEMIPHYEFWKTVPASFVSGVKFIANGCRSPPSYEQI
ncbi:hypothetical protein ONE63_006953 [Megalurothrips usitatus]|uniref:Autophagy-related protein 27 n=1 Tax=Megalurothrips usitatus TaxID=439358 RepID=A0AAV7XY13_9NEOP|nr:hypothetical protein ONE63_006953 [Megalurothrips usitatus]